MGSRCGVSGRERPGSAILAEHLGQLRLPCCAVERLLTSAIRWGIMPDGEPRALPASDRGRCKEAWLCHRDGPHSWWVVVWLAS